MNRTQLTLFLSRLFRAFLALAALASTGWSFAQAQSAAVADPFLPGAWTKLAGNPVLSPGVSGAWDDHFAFAPSVILDGATYKMWYAGSSNANPARQIGYATSPDGLIWMKQGAAPVLMPGAAGSWEAIGVSFPAVIKDGSIYKMWYTGVDASSVGRVGYATSPDGIVWTKYAGNPVLGVGAAGSWDSTYAGMASVVKAGATYRLWYRGGNETSGGIGYATSPDGLAWTKLDPAITGGSGAWDTTPYHPDVIFDGAGYHMWYSGCNEAADVCQTGYAISTDGAAWTRKGMVLAQGSSGAWDDESADYAAVLQAGNTIKMWYSGYDGAAYSTGFASSTAVVLNNHLYLPKVVKQP